MDLTKDQIKEVLERLRDYSGWMYYGENVRDLFDSQRRKIDGKECKIELLDSGLYKISNIDNTDYAIYNIMICTGLVKNGLDNLDFKLLGMEYRGDRKEFDKVAVFILSSFQRSVAFIFFSRMHDDSIGGIAEDLFKIIPNENN